MYWGQSQNCNVFENSRQSIPDLDLALIFSSVLLQSLSLPQRNSFSCLRSLFKYRAKHAKSKHFPVCLALFEYIGKDERGVDGGITGGGRPN